MSRSTEVWGYQKTCSSAPACPDCTTMPRSETDSSTPGCLYPSKPKYTVTSCPIHASGTCSAIDSPLSAYSAILPDRGRMSLEAILAALGARSMHDPARELRSVYLPRTRVNRSLLEAPGTRTPRSGRYDLEAFADTRRTP